MSKIKEAIEKACKIPSDMELKPQRTLYEKIGINQKRFGQILKGTAKPFSDELKAISTHFNIPITELV
jgi:hypothetical protein